jgi:hypothetical protein
MAYVPQRSPTGEVPGVGYVTDDATGHVWYLYYSDEAVPYYFCSYVRATSWASLSPSPRVSSVVRCGSRRRAPHSPSRVFLAAM